jgi:hypothetical protein
MAPRRSQGFADAAPVDGGVSHAGLSSAGGANETCGTVVFLPPVTMILPQRLNARLRQTVPGNQV